MRIGGIQLKLFEGAPRDVQVVALIEDSVNGEFVVRAAKAGLTLYLWHMHQSHYEGLCKFRTFTGYWIPFAYVSAPNYFRRPPGPF